MSTSGAVQYIGGHYVAYGGYHVAYVGDIMST